MAAIEYVQPIMQYHLENAINPSAEKIVQIAPQVLFGEGHLFKLSDHKIVLSDPFKELLNFLVQTKSIDSSVLTVKTLQELNDILQKEFKRPDLKERYNLSDTEDQIKNRKALDQIFSKLGFVEAATFEGSFSADHVLVFGALVPRMEFRIQETFKLLRSNIKAEGKIFLLGSDRKLNLDELKRIYEIADEKWKAFFEKTENQVEGYAFQFLWEYYAPDFKEATVTILSNKIGASFCNTQGIRPTTQSTIDEWQEEYYEKNPGKVVLAVSEQPYLRLTSQVLTSTVLKKKKIDDAIKRLLQTQFKFAHPQPINPPLVSVVLDEIARNVYNTNETFKILNNFP